MSEVEKHEVRPSVKRAAGYIAKALKCFIPNFEQIEGLKRTPIRIAASWARMLEGYDMEVKLSRTYTERSDLVASFGIPFVSLCEHHLAPFYGTVDIGYIPRHNVTGMSKLDQLVKKYSLRLQIQERLTSQIADELWQVLQPHGVIVVTEAIHTCKLVEGFQPTSYTCSACKGVFLWNTAPREEFFALRSQQRRR